MVSKPTRFYRLTKQGKPREMLDRSKWSSWMKLSVHDRTIGQLELSPGVVIETMFDGVDKAEKAGVPLLWSTRVYGVPQFEKAVWKWESTGQAIEGHKGVVESLVALIARGQANAERLMKLASKPPKIVLE